jgi:membrane protein involved in colicin uptake
MATTKRVAQKAAKKTAAPAAKKVTKKPVAKKAAKTAASKAPKKVASKAVKVKKTSAQPKKAPVKKIKLPGKAAKPAANAATRQVTKTPRRRNKALIEKKAPVPNLDHTVNMGPERGDNSFPASNKRAGKSSNRGATGAAADSTSGPGGQTKQGADHGDKDGA